MRWLRRDSVSLEPELRWDVPAVETLRRLMKEPLPLAVQAGDAEHGFRRDLYYDTPDATLRQRGVTCRFRMLSDDRRELMLSLVEDAGGVLEYRRFRAPVEGAEAMAGFNGASEPARILRSIVNPAALVVDLELEIERWVRRARRGWLVGPRFEVHYDIVTVRAAGLSRSFQELKVRELRAGRPNLEQLARAIGESYGLRTVVTTKRVRGSMLRTALESESLVRGVGGGRWVSVIALDRADVICVKEKGTVRLPASEGSGEDACRDLLRRTLGSGVGDLHLLSTVLGEGRIRALEVWIASRVDSSDRNALGDAVLWMPLQELMDDAMTSAVHDPPTVAALGTLKHTELYTRLAAYTLGATTELRTAELRALPSISSEHDSDVGARIPLLDAEMSQLEFNSRVLAMAEDDSVPLLERLRYLSIVSTNLDEFFMVRVGGLKRDAEEVLAESDGRLTTETRLEAIARRVRALVARQHACFEACRRALHDEGVKLVPPGALDPARRSHLHSYFRSTIFPYLTPRAITTTPGHSLPLIPDLALCIAVVLRDLRTSGPLHFAEVTVPSALPRFIELPTGKEFVAIEDVIRPELPLLYPGRHVEHAYLFRVTRDADLDVDVRRAGNLAQAIAERTQRRRQQPVVRIEVERAMPPTLRQLLLRELQLEPGALPGSLGANDEYQIEGLMDLGALTELAGLPMPAHRFPPFEPNPAIDARRSVWETLRAHDVLVHHPYDDFRTTVARFFDEAAEDPDVAAIKVTLYRAGERSPIVDALLRAANAGKDVTVFVELKARFDEQRNVRWAKQLESAGVHVVEAVLGVKNHAKVALVIRREDGVPRRYVHIGTGNYNADTSRGYTDLGLFTAHEQIGADVSDLFNSLTGSSVPTAHAYRECLVAPAGLITGLCERIEREAEHAREGRGGRIRMKVNGISDREVVHALYRASQAGVEIDLIVRGICTLTPGVPGISDNIRVISIVGRFLEHARIMHFGGGGAPEYFIGSADLRPRNLRRRVEVLAPVHDIDLRSRLDWLLDLELSDPTAWELSSNGTYQQRQGREAALGTPAMSAQERLMFMAADAREALA
jgi:polyphosphate kinase